MKRTGNFGAFGIPSVITILLVLVLAVFSSLTVITAKAELSLAEKYADAVSAYYSADSESERKIAGIAAQGTEMENYSFSTKIDTDTVLWTTVSTDGSGNITACRKMLENTSASEYETGLNLMK